jgi:hypothetical protein
MNTRRSTVARIGLLLPAVVSLALTAAPILAQKGKPAGDFKAAAAVWKKAQMHAVMLDKIIVAKKMKAVHEAAFAVRDQVKLLPAKSKALSADNQAKLAKGVKTVADLAARLDEAGDNGRQTEAEALNKKMHVVLNAIAGLYPAGALTK